MLVSVPFSSLVWYWSPWEKFPGEHHVKLWDGTKLLRFAVYIVQYRIIIVSFGQTDHESPWSGLTQKGTILFAFLRWPLSLWPREQALSESKIAGQLWPRPRLFSWCENKAKVIRRPCDSTYGNLNKTGVREKSRGVYLAVGWVLPSYSMIFHLC